MTKVVAVSKRRNETRERTRAAWVVGVWWKEGRLAAHRKVERARVGDPVHRGVRPDVHDDTGESHIGWAPLVWLAAGRRGDARCP